MKILFNLISCGLGNNGGTSTIIKSANTLQKLDHEVIIVDSGKNQHTWNSIECDHIIVKNLSDFPKGDAVIATGFKSVDTTIKLPPSCGKKYHYIRLLENYHYSNIQDFINVIKAPTIKIVNSICLQRKLLTTYNEPSIIIRPGYDFDKIYPLNIRGENREIIIGGLYNEGSKRKNKRTEWISFTYEFLKQKYNIKLYMFGSDGIPKFYTDLYIKNPSFEEKNKLFNMIDIWLSPSCSEGLHLTPAEALLTECSVVGNNSELSGTEDFLIDSETGLVSENNIESFIANTEILINHKNIRKEFGKKGRLKVMTLGTREENMQKLIAFLGENKNEKERRNN